MGISIWEVPGFLLAGFVLMHAIIGIHELGHWLAGRIGGYHPTAFLVGSGPKIGRFRQGTCVYAWSLLPTHGRVLAVPSARSCSLFWQALFVLGGIAAELSLAAVVWLMIRSEPTWSWVWGSPFTRFLCFTALLFIFYTVASSLLPATLDLAGERIPNDGLQLLLLWKGRRQLPENRKLILEGETLERLTKSGAQDQAAAFLKELLLKYPRNASLQLLSMYWRMRQGDHDGARRSFETSLQQEPEGSPNRVRLIDQYLSLLLAQGPGERAGEADRYSYEALLLAPDSITLRGTRGSVLAELGRNTEARTLRDDVLNHTDTDVDRAYCHIYLAWIDAQEGKRAGALNHLKRSKATGAPIEVIPRLEKKIRELVDSPLDTNGH